MRRVRYLLCDGFRKDVQIVKSRFQMLIDMSDCFVALLQHLDFLLHLRRCGFHFHVEW